MTARNLQPTFERLLRQHRGIVFKVAGIYSRSIADRDDLMQEISAQLWRSFGSYDEAHAKFSTWMYRIALNVAITFVRSNSQRGRQTVPFDDLPLEQHTHDIVDGNAVDPSAEQHLRLLQTFIDRQAPLDRALLLLYLDDRAQREIGEILGLSEANVSTKIGRLKQRIRNEL